MVKTESILPESFAAAFFSDAVAKMEGKKRIRVIIGTVQTSFEFVNVFESPFLQLERTLPWSFGSVFVVIGDKHI